MIVSFPSVVRSSIGVMIIDNVETPEGTVMVPEVDVSGEGAAPEFSETE